MSSLRDTDTSHGSWVISIRSTRKPSPTPFSSVHTVRQSQLQEHSWPKQNTGEFFACLSAFDSAIPQRQKHGSSFRASQDALQARHTSTDWVVRWGHYRIQGWWSWNGTWRSSKSRSSLTDGQIKALREHSGSQNNSCLITEPSFQSWSLISKSIGFLGPLAHLSLGSFKMSKLPFTPSALALN